MGWSRKLLIHSSLKHQKTYSHIFPFQYKCLDTPDGIYNYHPDAWLWTCYDKTCPPDAIPTSGTLVFEDPLPAYNDYGLGQWPLDPDQCYVALLNRNVGRSPPPYDMVCEGDEFIM